jgi:type III secretion system FlhB-like substrate exporter
MRAERIVQLFLKHQLEKAVPIEVYNAIGMLKSGLQMRGFKCVPS